MKFGLRQVAEFLELPTSTDADAMVTGWSVDSRSLLAGDLFFALRGSNHDGHNYIGEVFRKGAAAVVVDQEISDSQAPPGRILRVADTLQGLQQLASRTTERDSLQGQFDQFRKGIKNLLGQAELPTSSSSQPVTTAVEDVAGGKS